MNPNLEMRVDGTRVFQGADADIKSLQVNGGSVQADTLEIQETADGLPVFTAATAVPNGHVSPTFTSLTGYNNSGRGCRVKVHFNGRGGADAVVMTLLTSHGAVYTPDTLDTAQSGNIGIASDATFAHAAVGAVLRRCGGSDVRRGGRVAGAGRQRVAGRRCHGADDQRHGDGGRRRVAGESEHGQRLLRADHVQRRSKLDGPRRDVQPGPGAGQRGRDKAACDPNGAALTTVPLDGDNLLNTDTSVDTLWVQTTPASVTTVTLLGGQGSDNFRVYNPATTTTGTVDGIREAVVVSPDRPGRNAVGRR